MRTPPEVGSGCGPHRRWPEWGSGWVGDRNQDGEAFLSGVWGAVAGEGDYGWHFQEAGLGTGDMALKAVRDPRSFWLR